jgi:excisionase family DNA binding protein
MGTMTTLLTIKQVAVWLNIKPSTLYAWAGQGKIPCRKIHGLVRFDPDAIRRWLGSFQTPHVLAGPEYPSAHLNCDLDQLIAAAKRDVYTLRHGETRPKSSLIGKEEADGASQTK